MVYIVTLIFLLITVGLIWFLVSHDRGPKEPMGALWAAFGFGFLALVVAGSVEGLLGISLDSKNLVSIMVACLLVGVIEEACKFIPLSLFIYKKSYFNEHNDGIIYFAIAGLTFGLFENLAYTFIYGSSAGLMRLLLLPIFHGAGTAAIGYFLAKKKVDGGSLAKTVLALVTVMILHGFYNFGVSAGIPQFFIISLMITLLLLIGLFILFMLANNEDRDEGISAAHLDKFCPYCGHPNLNHSLFCESCGKKPV